MASTAPYNFGQASGRDSILYGSARPGAQQKVCYDPSSKMPTSEVLKWVEFMKQHGMKRVVSLLTPSEMDTYEPGFEELMKEHFVYGNVDIKAGGGFQELVQLVDAGYTANEKVLMHCWGGRGRAGAALAAFLAHHYNVAPEAAAQEIQAFAGTCNCSRGVDVANVTSFMAS